MEQYKLDIIIATDSNHLVKSVHESTADYTEQRRSALTRLLDNNETRLTVIDLMIDDGLTLEKALMGLL